MKCFCLVVNWGFVLATDNFKCHNCAVCNGKGCLGELPGMGGVREGENFILNVEGWKTTREMLSEIPDFPHDEKMLKGGKIPDGILRLAPITGAVENIGFGEEVPYYKKMIEACWKAGFKLSIGDGCPDEKLLSGIEAVRSLQEESPNAKAAVFIKPYPDDKFYERMDWADGVAEVIGVDIDSYNIITMRNLVQLEKKSAEQLKAIRARTKLPFAIKGIFTQEDVQLVRDVKPDIAYISNHGGRVDTRRGSTAEFLLQYEKVLRQNCGELWIDGGIRTIEDIRTALSLGASQVLMGRPLITALCYNGEEGVAKKFKEFSDTN